jgi:pimeloyl-ACP methyl ester carboxylesterase
VTRHGTTTEEIVMHASRTDRGARPSLLLQAAELPRAWGEYAALVGSAGLLPLVPRGDGAPVVVLPGFTGSDRSTFALRTFLGGVGHRSVAWGLGRNIGPSRKIIDGIDDLVERMVEEQGQPVHLIGWSLGGIFARHVAVRRPELVRRVITLGSPYRLLDHKKSHAAWIYEMYAPFHDAAGDLPPDGPVSRPLSVPSTSIYSRTDGIVPWWACTEQPSALAENVHVFSSHNGLGHNALAMYVIADRLALPAGEHQPFEAPLVLKPFFAFGA